MYSVWCKLGAALAQTRVGLQLPIILRRLIVATSTNISLILVEGQGGIVFASEVQYPLQTIVLQQHIFRRL